MNLYLVVLGFGFDREEVVKYLEGRQDTATWFYSMPYSFFIVSSLTAAALSDVINEKYPGPTLRHFVTRVTPEDNKGWMPRDHWEMFNRYLR